MLRRRSPSNKAEVAVPAVEETRPGNAKGRPTPKRRDSSPRRAPITEAPRTRREASAWQRQQRKQSRPSAAIGKPMTTAQRREAMARGDAAVLPRTHQGPTRKLARDYVDSRRLFGNFLLLAFIPMILALVTHITVLNVLTVVVFVFFLGECLISGRKIVALSRERGNQNPGSALSVGLYAGSRAYLWRLPRPQVNLGDPI
jgi:Protein of unknown function (DUF3043)